MFFSVARLRPALALAAFFLPPLGHARSNELFTSSVSYCSPPEEILIEQFDISYFQVNNSVSFNVTAASVLPNLNVSANLYINVYGIQPINLTLDLCGVFGGVLCPLPMFNFSGQDSLPLPSSVDVAKELPGVAWVIPDLEAYAQLTLIEVGTGQVRACVQSTLSNGWSTHQYGVEWTTAAIALLALASAVWHSLKDTSSLAPIRLLDIFYLYQSIAASGLLGLNYPSVYTSYTVNFSWALGLFVQSPISAIQTAINNMRHSTGGSLADASSGGAVPLVNRKLSPYNSVDAATFRVPQSLFAKVSTLPQVDLAKAVSARGLPRAVAGTALHSREVAVVTADSSDVLQAGIPIYANTIGIATANAFMTAFLVALILLAIVLAALGVGWALYTGLSRSEGGRRHLDRMPGLRSGYVPFARAWGLRFALIIVFPISIFAFYQWTLHDSWVSILLSVVSLVAAWAGVLVPSFFLLRHYIPSSLRGAPKDVTASVSLSPLSAPFLAERVFYVVLVLFAMFVKALIVGFVSSHGLVQAIFFVAVDALLLAAIIILKPHRTRGADVLSGYLAVVRFVAAGLLIAFAESVQLSPIPRVVIGVIVAVIFSVAVVIMFFNMLGHLGLWRMIRRLVTRGKRAMGMVQDTASYDSADRGSDASMLEKRDVETDVEKASPTSILKSDHLFLRPENPSPPSTGLMTSHSLGSEQPSYYSVGSGTTLGDPLPRRWSFQHSPPPSESHHSHPSPVTGVHSVAPSPSTPSSGLPPRRHSRHVSASAPPSPIEERPSYEGYS